MPTYKRSLLLMTVVFVVAVSTSVSALRERELLSPGSDRQKARDEQQQTEEDQIPTVDFDSPEPSDLNERAKRWAINARYDNSVLVRKDDATGGAVESTYFSDWDLGLPALPAGKSEVIIIGEIVEAKAHLSNDKTGVYSEFTTRIEKLFKNSGPTALTPGEVISLERQGGAVRYSTGRKYHYRVSGQNMPRRGRHYVFFLNTTEAGQSFRIITAYELNEGKVFPLDVAEQFNAYKGMGKVEFIGAVQGAGSRN